MLGTVGRPMPGVTIRIVKENPSSPQGYDTLVEADSDNTKVEAPSNIEHFLFIYLWNNRKVQFLFKVQKNRLKVNY